MRTLDGVHATVALAPDEPPPELSPGQSAAVEFVGREFGDAGIASRLDVSESAVKGRLKRAKRAYGVKDRAALVRRVLDDGLDDGLDDQRSRASPRRG